MWRKSLKSSAIYLTKSKIENLKIKIILKTISSLLKLKNFSLKTNNNQIHGNNRKDIRKNKYDKENIDNDDEDEDSDENQESTRSRRKENKEYDDDSIECIEIKWQEKIFSRYEIEFYKDLQNCVTDLQKEYHEKIIRDNLVENYSGNNSEYKKIFTYIDGDNFCPENVDNSFSEKKKYNELKLRSEKFSHPYSKSKVMYIYADLNPDTLLFMIRWLEKENMLIIYPDFNEFNSNPYFIEIDTDYRHLYSYAIENISLGLKSELKTVPSSSSEKAKFKSKTNIQLEDDTGGDWNKVLIKNQKYDIEKNLSLYDIPPKNYIRINFLFNINQAQEFEYNSLHIRYYIKYPNTAMKTTKLDKNSGKLTIIPDIIHESGNLNGSTHSSNYIWNQNVYNDNKPLEEYVKIWNFSYSFQLTFLLREHESHNNSNNFNKTLQIFFELISIDSWKRERNEGYCFLLIPIEIGKKNYNLKCYRPDYGFKNRIERFFIGGRRLFDITNFNNINDFGGFLNRFHTKCITTGIINFNTECILQRNLDEINLYGNEKKTTGTGTVGMTLNDVMRSYQEARKRLELTTKVYNTTTTETNV